MSGLAKLVHPHNGATNVDPSQAAKWSAVPDAQTYKLHVGTSPGKSDLIDSGEISQTGHPIVELPPGTTVYATLFTKSGGEWRHSDSSFATGKIAPEFVFPVDGAVSVDTSRLFCWTPVAGAQAYRLDIGGDPGGDALFLSGELSTTNCRVTGLPQAGVLYARAWAKVNDAWSRYSDIAFSLDPLPGPSSIVFPSNGASNVDLGQPFEWAEVAIARGYRLMVGTSPGGHDLHDSGEIHVTRRFVPDLPVGMPLFGRLETMTGGSWNAADFTFTAAAASTAMASQIAAALWATGFVREMATEHHRPFGWTELSRRVPPRYSAVCTDYAAVLLRVLSEMNVQAPARLLDVAFNPNRYEMHRLIELFDSDTDRWIVLDPTFALALRVRGGGWATADEFCEVVHTFEWNRIEYVFVGGEGDAHAKGYYVDYPMLFLNVYHEGQPMPLGVGPSPRPYLEAVSLPLTSPYDFYTVRGTVGDLVEVVIDGVVQQLRCDGVDGLSKGFGASSIDSPAESPASFDVFRFRRFVF